MFGKNAMLKLDHGNGDTLQVVKGSPFLTIQGEGPYAGHPAVFVRLHGCHLRCTFCDTDFDNPFDPVWQIDALAHEVMLIRGFARLVVVTGGEPMRQNILPLCTRLRTQGFRVQIETAGTFWIDGIEEVAEIVCSPKTPVIHPMIYAHATAFKYIIDSRSEFKRGSYIPVTATQPGARSAKLAEPREDALIYLSPMDVQDERANRINRRLVASLAIEHGVIAGLQLHKFMEVD